MLEIARDVALGRGADRCGLPRTNQLSLERALAWIRAASTKGPSDNDELCAETFIQYKGARAGEVDWRPTETIPEDFYAL